MKTLAKLFFLSLMLFGVAFAEEENPPIEINPLATEPERPIIQKEKPKETLIKDRYTYIKLGPSNNPSLIENVMPSIGAGMRFGLQSSAVDISLGTGIREKNYFYYFPKILYLRYTHPKADNSFFYGGGLSWFGSKYSNNQFHGITTHLSGGYEFDRNQRISEFIQADFSQPTIPAYQTGKFPYPTLEFSLGIGF